VQHIELLSVGLFPIKLALVVLRAKCREQTVGLLATVYDGPRLCACLARRALSKDVLLHLRSLAPLLSCSSGARGRRGEGGEEGANVTEGQADARTALRRIFSLLRSLVRVHAVHPASISLEAHYEKRVVRKWNALRRALYTTGGGSTTMITVVTVANLLVPSNILLRPKRHGAPSAKGEVHDARAAHDVDRLVRVFRDVVRARAVELDEHVIHWVLERVLDVCPDGGYCGREGEQRW
jgi:hypothetical protein